MLLPFDSNSFESWDEDDQGNAISSIIEKYRLDDERVIDLVSLQPKDSVTPSVKPAEKGEKLYAQRFLSRLNQWGYNLF